MAWTALAAWLKTMQTSVQNLTLYVIDNLNYLKGRTDAYDTHDHSASDPTAVDHANLANVSANQHHAQVHGAGDHTDVSRERFIEPNYVAVQGFLGVMHGALQADGAFDGAMAVTFKIPNDFVSTPAVCLVWVCSAASGNGVFECNGGFGAAGEIPAAFTEIDPATFATGGAGVINVSQVSFTELSGIAKGDYVDILVNRHGEDGNDTLSANVIALGILLTYTAEQ